MLMKPMFVTDMDLDNYPGYDNYLDLWRRPYEDGYKWAVAHLMDPTRHGIDSFELFIVRWHGRGQDGLQVTFAPSEWMLERFVVSGLAAGRVIDVHRVVFGHYDEDEHFDGPPWRLERVTMRWTSSMSLDEGHLQQELQPLEYDSLPCTDCWVGDMDEEAE